MKCRICGKLFICKSKVGYDACKCSEDKNYVCTCTGCDKLTPHVCITYLVKQDKKVIGGFRIRQ